MTRDIFAAGFGLRGPAGLKGDTGTVTPEALAAKTSAEAARDGAVTAKTAAETARDASVTAKTASETARDAAIAARVGAEAVGTTNDTVIAGRINTPGSATATALSASFVGITEGPLDLVARYDLDDTGGTDVSAALLNGILVAQDARGEAFLGPGTFKIATANVKTDQSFAQPRIRGAGHRLTTVQVAGAYPAFKFVGGSGGPSGGCLTDMSIQGIGAGATAATGVILSGVNHFDTQRVHFKNLDSGVQHYNQDSGSFTEFCVAEDCSFDDTVRVPISYIRGAGTESFHGSGFHDCTFNQSATAPRALVDIQSGALVYNAPFDGTVFTRSATRPIIKNAGMSPAQTFGTMRMEGGTALMVDPDGTYGILHAGQVTALGSGLVLENAPGKKHFRLVRRSQHNPDGSLSYDGMSLRTRRTLSSSSTSLVDLDTDGIYMASVSIIGPSYQRHETLLLFRKPGLGDSITSLANQFYDPGSKGVPVYAMSGGVLSVTNAGYTTSFTADLGVQQVLSNINSPML